MACAPELDLREGYEIYNKMILAGSPIVDHRPVPICPTGVSSQVVTEAFPPHTVWQRLPLQAVQFFGSSNRGACIKFSEGE
ncbi:hypothetical protein WJX82_003890 [Trebouxia sp. C0006]